MRITADNWTYSKYGSAVIVRYRQHIEDRPLKHQVLVNRGHCTIRHHRTYCSLGHYFQEQEM